MFHYSSCRDAITSPVCYFTDAHLPQMSTVLIGFAGFTRQQCLPLTLKTYLHLRSWLGQVKRVVRKLLLVLGAAEMPWQAYHPSMQRWNASGLMCMVPGVFHRWVSLPAEFGLLSVTAASLTCTVDISLVTRMCGQTAFATNFRNFTVLFVIRIKPIKMNFCLS